MFSFLSWPMPTDAAGASVQLNSSGGSCSSAPRSTSSQSVARYIRRLHVVGGNITRDYWLKSSSERAVNMQDGSVWLHLVNGYLETGEG